MWQWRLIILWFLYIYIYIYYITYYQYIYYIYIYIFHLICNLSEYCYGLFRSDPFFSMAFSFNFFPPLCLAFRLLLHLFLKSHKYSFNGSRAISDILEAILSMESRIWPLKGFLQKRKSCAKQLLWKSILCLYSKQHKDLCRRLILREMETYRLLHYLKLTHFACTLLRLLHMIDGFTRSWIQLSLSLESVIKKIFPEMHSLRQALLLPIVIFELVFQTLQGQTKSSRK